MPEGQNFFDKNSLITYSERFFLTLNQELVDKAQAKIYSKEQASSTDLWINEKINSVLSAFTIPSTPAGEAFLRMAINMAFYQTKQMKRSKYEGFRITSDNYRKIQYLLEVIKPLLTPKGKPLIGNSKDNSPKEDKDEQVSIAINCLLVLFNMFDVQANKMVYVGME